MKPPTAESQSYEFRFPQLDTMLKLEVQGDSAMIVASRNTFSRRRKELFVRELAAEGFISDSVAGSFGKDNDGQCGGIRWVLDEGLALSDVFDVESERFGLKVFKTSLMLVGVFFVIILGGSTYSGGSSSLLTQVGGIHGTPMSQR
jgi:hypothetical protein